MKKFESTIISLHGRSGKKWLNTLPDLVEHIAREWGLTNVKPMPNLLYNFVASAEQNNKPVILKLNPDVKAIKQEVLTLRAFAGNSTIELLAELDGALLLQRALPGTNLKSYYPERDDEAVDIVCKIISKLHTTPTVAREHFPKLEKRLKKLIENNILSPGHRNKVKTIANKFMAASPPKVLLHADLHHENILLHDGDWLAIDPKGLIGDPTYELAPFLCNPLEHLPYTPNASHIIKTRIKQFACNLNMDEQRILMWCYIHSANAMIWRREDNLDAEPFEKLSDIFEKMVV